MSAKPRSHERWAAALHAARLEHDVADAEVQRAVADEKPARAELVKAQRALDDAQAVLDAARAAVTGAEGRQSRFGLLRRDAQERLREIEDNPPSA